MRGGSLGRVIHLSKDRLRTKTGGPHMSCFRHRYLFRILMHILVLSVTLDRTKGGRKQYLLTEQLTAPTGASKSSLFLLMRHLRSQMIPLSLNFTNFARSLKITSHLSDNSILSLKLDCLCGAPVVLRLVRGESVTVLTFPHTHTHTHTRVYINTRTRTHAHTHTHTR